MEKAFVIGLDYGTDSVRAIIVDAENGEALASAASEYPRWRRGTYCDPSKNRFRQHPRDHLEGLARSVGKALEKAPKGAGQCIKAISIAATGSSPLPVDRDGTALALREDFADNPNAMMVLWKDHTAVAEAAEINELSRHWGGVDFTRFSGGVYSSEWFWAKILHITRRDAAVRQHAVSWVEHSDWLPGVLSGNLNPLTMRRNRCAAGHKAMWHESWGGLPQEAFLTKLDADLVQVRDHYDDTTWTANHACGTLTKEWAHKLGLPAGIPVGVGALDAHMGAVGAGIGPYALVKVMGTSTCDMLLAPGADIGTRTVKGICGQVDGSIVPDMVGLEAGQSAFGDLYAWFREVLAWPLRLLSSHLPADQAETASERMLAQILPELSNAAAACPINPDGIVALDWMNGRRTPDANQALKGALSGLNLASDAPAIFRALVEATAFGAKKIVHRFEAEGVRINEVIAMGGVAKKSPFVMQTVADVLDRPIKVVRSEQCVALGAAIFAAVVGGMHHSVKEAQEAMGSGIETVYTPDPHQVPLYARLFKRYSQLGDFVESQTTHR